ncbi:MAG TPA: hypothetical protein VL988_06070 [Solirubrobacteraceae bacterium]|nr:hypothetical protein [Solirubrobacteraceae bacterium]
MRGPRLLASLLAALALGACAASAAFAEPEFLPGKAGTTLTGKSKKVKLQAKAGGTIECTASKTEGELTSKTTESLLLDLEGCKALGLKANSPGDVGGVILINATAELCFVNLSPLEAGLIVKPTSAIIIDIPATGEELEIKNDFVGKIEPINTSSFGGQIVISQKGGVQSIDGCRNASNELVKHSLTMAENGGTPKQSGLEVVEGTIAYAIEQELMA